MCHGHGEILRPEQEGSTAYLFESQGFFWCEKRRSLSVMAWRVSPRNDPVGFQTLPCGICRNMRGIRSFRARRFMVASSGYSRVARITRRSFGIDQKPNPFGISGIESGEGHEPKMEGIRCRFSNIGAKVAAESSRCLRSVENLQPHPNARNAGRQRSNASCPPSRGRWATAEAAALPRVPAEDSSLGAGGPDDAFAQGLTVSQSGGKLP